MKILYLGDDFKHATSAHRAAALRRLGHEVAHLDPAQEAVPASRWICSLNIRTGFRLFAPLVRRRLIRAIRGQRFDLAWIDAGPQLGPAFYRELVRRGLRIINYNHDDPFGNRDHRKWDLYKSALRYHDLTAVVREENIAEALACGSKKVVRVFRSYDPVAHAPLPVTPEDKQKWSSDVVFVGTWMPERGPFLARLLQLGVPLSIWGVRWQKAAERARLQPAVRGEEFLYGSDYVKALQCSKVALGLLSVGNRDLHTTRSAEIPFMGGACFCAERTAEHLAMFREGEEAVFWSSAEECAAQCRKALADPAFRERLSGAARRRIIQMGLSNDENIAWILDALRAEASDIGRPLPKH